MQEYICRYSSRIKNIRAWRLLNKYEDNLNMYYKYVNINQSYNIIDILKK